MKVHVFDVEHGECVVVETPTGHTVMIGAGHNSTTGWRPSLWFAQRGAGPTVAVISNLDEDHSTDLPNFGPDLMPWAVVKNHSIDSNLTRVHKTLTGGLGRGVSTALGWHDRYTGSNVPINFGGVTVQTFWHPVGTFPASDYNNLSVVTYVEYAGVGMMIPSDLEKAGWLAHLQNPNFVLALSRAKVLMGSHHGRENGYCPDVFSWCKPDIMIISDKPVAHDTQRHDLYRPHVTGLRHVQTGETRRVLSTRRDGKLLVDVAPTGNYMVYLGD